MAKEAPGATAGLVLGILSIVVCQPLGIWGLIESNKALRAIEADESLDGYSNASAGRVMSIIGIVLFGIALVMLVLVLGFGLFAASEMGDEFRDKMREEMERQNPGGRGK